jgi:putative hemolysin
MRFLALTAVAALLLAACAPTAQPASPAPSANAMAAACSAKGGAIQPVGKAQIPTCVTPYADAGKACTDKSQCQGACVLEGNLEPQGPVTGACQKTDRQFGCYAKVVNGKTTGAICVD